MNDSKKFILWARRVIGATMILLAPLCLIAASWGIHFDRWNVSVSGLYWTNARPVFIGLSSILIFMMFAYKGYDWKDRAVNIIFCICLIIIVLFPSFSDAVLTSNPVTDYDLFPAFNKKISWQLHTVSFAVMTFDCFINMFFLFTKHGDKMTEKKILRNKIYRLLSVIFIVPFVIETFCVFFSSFERELPAWVFFMAQLIEFTAAGTAWLIKGGAVSVLNDVQQKE